MRINNCLLLFLFLYSIPSKGQDYYQAGTSSVSLEPDNSIFSVALAGYGFPREGRFSLTWDYIDQTPDFTAISSLNGKFYAATRNNELLEGFRGQQGISWKKVGRANQITSLTSVNGKLYAVCRKGQLWVSAKAFNKISWKKIGASNNVTSITSLNGKLYAANANGDLMAGVISKNSVSWNKAGSAKNLISMAAHDDKIYAVNSGDTLLSAKPTNPLQENLSWTQIGRNNSSTFDIHVKHITVLDGRLYAISSDNKLYIAEHSSKGTLSSRALAIRNKDKTIVIVGVDVTGFNYSLINEIKDAIYIRRNIPRAAVLINASHTHFAPVTQAWATWAEFYQLPDSTYLDKAKKAIIRSIELALDNMSPSNIYFGRGSTDIGLNRRGASNPEKPYDNTLDVLKVADSVNKKIKSILFLTGCHPVFKNAGREAYVLDANYPGVAKKLIEERANASNAIFIQGCGGDINPQNDSYVQTGQDLTADVLGVLDGNMTKLKGDISFDIDEILIPVKPWSLDSINKFKTANASKIGDLEAEKNVRWADLMIRDYQKDKVPATLPLYVQTINIGNWKFVGLSREVVTEYGPAIRKIWPGKTVTVAGYCNDVSSYLPTDWHIKEKLYEGNGSFFWYGQSGIPPVNVLEMIIGRIKSLNK